MSELNWIKHDGGPMPVPGDTIVEVVYDSETKGRHNKNHIRADWMGEDYNNWHWNNPLGDLPHSKIVEYAVIKESVAQPAIDAHYTKYAIQPMEFSLANGLDAAQHTVIKYTVRYRDKGGIRDLRAAIRVLELMIEREEKAKANG